VIDLFSGRIYQAISAVLLLGLLALGVAHWRQSTDLTKAEMALAECQSAADKAARSHADQRAQWAEASRQSEAKQRAIEQQLRAEHEASIKNAKRIESTLRDAIARSDAAANSLRQQAVAAARAIAARASPVSSDSATAPVGDAGLQTEMVPAWLYDRIDEQRRDLAHAIDRTHAAQQECARLYSLARATQSGPEASP
jgi:hypothetical protein